MRLRVLVILALGLVFMPFAPTSAQGGEPARMEIGGINREDFPDLTLLLNVWDIFNVPVPGLTVDDLSVTIDGAPVACSRSRTRRRTAHLCGAGHRYEREYARQAA